MKDSIHMGEGDCPNALHIVRDKRRESYYNEGRIKLMEPGGEGEA